MTDQSERDAVDPIEFLRRALAIRPEDAAEVRREAAMTAEHRAAYRRWLEAEARAEQFVSLEPITDRDLDSWPQQKRDEYVAALAELTAARDALRAFES